LSEFQKEELGFKLESELAAKKYSWIWLNILTPREYETRDGTHILDFQAALVYLLTKSEFPYTAASLSTQPRAARDGVSGVVA
jgi:hypothetical protein